MTRATLLFLFVISFVRIGFAQNDDKVLAIATYSYSHLMDTTKADVYYYGVHAVAIESKRFRVLKRGFDPGHE